MVKTETPETVAIRNTTKDTLFVPNFPAFFPGEVREVTTQEAEFLLLNPFLEKSETSKDAVVQRGQTRTRETAEKK